VTNLWINAPVFDSEGNAIGMLGTGINMSKFIDDLYRDYHESSQIYFFNSQREITGARELDDVKNKVTIHEKFGQTGEDIHLAAQGLEGIVSLGCYYENGVVVIGAIPALDWYIVAVRDFGAFHFLNSGMTVLFATMIILIFVVVVVFNVFAVNLLKESEQVKNKAVEARKAFESSIIYASKIQSNLLPENKVFENAFSDHSVIWKPRDVVGGDIYWAKNFDEGTVVCVCDCTGHGTPGALLTMLTASAFESFITNYNCNDPSRFIYLIDEKLASALNSKRTSENSEITDVYDGCDLAVVFIAKDGSVTVASGNINVFVCDGQEVTRHKGQQIFIGGGRLLGEDNIKSITIPANDRNKFYIATDGLFNQIGNVNNQKKQFGYKTFERIILEEHNNSQSVITDRIWDAFKLHQGEESQRDDVELIAFKPKREEI
jgi:hypothetical protein